MTKFWKQKWFKQALPYALAAVAVVATVVTAGALGPAFGAALAGEGGVAAGTVAGGTIAAAADTGIALGTGAAVGLEGAAAVAPIVEGSGAIAGALGAADTAAITGGAIGGAEAGLGAGLGATAIEVAPIAADAVTPAISAVAPVAEAAPAIAPGVDAVTLSNLTELPAAAADTGTLLPAGDPGAIGEATAAKGLGDAAPLGSIGNAPEGAGTLSDGGLKLVDGSTLADTAGSAAPPPAADAPATVTVNGPTPGNIPELEGLTAGAPPQPAGQGVTSALESKGGTSVLDAAAKEVPRSFATRAIDYVSANPFQAVGAIGTLATLGNGLMNRGEQQRLDAQQAARATQNAASVNAAARAADASRWANTPVRAATPRRLVNPAGSPGRDGELRYYENYAGGGHIQGPGDGMSDSIPAIARSADGSTRPIQVADGEFVIPADVVSGLGNGSTSAGVRELSNFMNRVREERHTAKPRQPPAVDPRRLMPR